MSGHFQELKIVDVRPQSELAVSLVFAVDPVQRARFAFKPGQYLTLRSSIDGADIRRSYSICSALHNHGEIEVGIKQVPEGTFSTFARTLGVGDTLQVMPPQGRFCVDIGGRHHYLLIASGSGITPCLSIARSVLHAELDSSISLVYGNRNMASMMFRHELQALKDRYTERLQLLLLFSAENQGADILNGRIDRNKIEALIDDSLINPSAANQTNTQADRQSSYGSESVLAVINLDGVRHEFSMDSSSETVLTAAQRNGLDLPFSCAGGMCCTCRCKVLNGQVALDANYSLADWEIDSGFTLACQARPKSSVVELDFDAS